MTIPEICIPIIISMVGIAYPISVQVIARIDDKYSSEAIRELFEKETTWKLFRYALWSSLIIVLAYCFRNIILFNINIIHIIISSLLINTALIILFFLLFAEKIFYYYSPNKLRDYLLNRSKTKNSFFELRDLLYYGIRHDSTFITAELVQYFSKLFENQRRKFLKKEREDLKYHDHLYGLIYDLQDLLSLQSNNQFINLKYKVFGSEWLLGNTDTCKISETTYRTIWDGLILCLNRNRTDIASIYWKVAFDYIESHLAPISPRYGDQRVVINQKEVKQRNIERRIFFEFNYAFGGLILYLDKYSLIRTIFNYTMSHPPRYKLLPVTMDDVFEAFLWFWDPRDYNIPVISFKFPFPDLEGVAADGVIKYWISKYTALLFVRQFHIHSYYVHIDPINYPAINDENKQALHDNLSYFVSLVDDIMKNTILMDLLFYKERNRTTDPKTFLDSLKSQIENEL